MILLWSRVEAELSTSVLHQLPRSSGFHCTQFFCRTRRVMKKFPSQVTLPSAPSPSSQDGSSFSRVTLDGLLLSYAYILTLKSLYQTCSFINKPKHTLNFSSHHQALNLSILSLILVPCRQIYQLILFIFCPFLNYASIPSVSTFP